MRISRFLIGLAFVADGLVAYVSYLLLTAVSP